MGGGQGGVQDGLPLERDLPTTSADLEALRRLPPTRMTGDEYLAFLASFGDAPFEELRRRPGPQGDEPFTS